MNPLAPEWIDKAEGDYAVAKRELRARTRPNYDAVCFHAQQRVEILQEHEISFAKTHDLVVLLDAVNHVPPLLEPFREPLELLTSFAVVFRYPGDSADKEMARDALTQCKAIRSVARSTLGLPDLK